MNAVGNDVVDLEDPETLGAHPRFAERIGATGGDVWFQFAAREAAFKALRKIAPEIRPIPRRFVVSAEGDRVACGDASVRIRCERSAAFVHVVAWSGASTILHGVEAVAPDEDASVRVRLLLREGVGRRLGLDPARLRVVREPDPSSWDGRGPPLLCLDDAPLDVDVSLSHHGRFVAWAAAFPAGRRRAGYGSCSVGATFAPSAIRSPG